MMPQAMAARGLMRNGAIFHPPNVAAMTMCTGRPGGYPGAIVPVLALPHVNPIGVNASIHELSRPSVRSGSMT